MGFADEVLLKIRALVEGQAQVRGLTGDVAALDSATSKLDGTYRDVNGRLRDAQNRFVATGQAAREAGSGFSFASGHLGKFSMNLTGLNAGLEIVQRVTQTVQGLVQGAGDLAHQFEAGKNAARQWEVVLERYGINAKTADAAMLSLSNRIGVNIESLKGMAAQYVKMGGSLSDFEKGTLAAASSWNDLSVKSISLEESIGNVTLGLAQGRSELMESSGIVVNASQAWEKWAKANDRIVKSMTDAEKAHAYALAVYKEEEVGISTLAERQTDLVKAETQAANSKRELGKALGEIVLPYYTRYMQVSAEVTTQSFEIARAFAQGEKGVQSLAGKYPQLVSILQTVQRVMADMQGTAREVFERTIQPALERLAPRAQQMGSVVAPTFVKLGQVFREVAGTAREAFERVIVPLFEAVAPVVMRVVQRVLPLVAQLAGAFGEGFKLIVTFWENIALPVIQTIAPVVQRAVDVVANVLSGVIATVKNIFQAVRAMIEGDWSKAWEHLKTAVGTALLNVQTLLEGAAKIVADVIPKVWDKAKELGTSIKDGILTGINGLQDQLAEAVGQAMLNMLGYIPDWAKRLLNITGEGESTMQHTGASGTLGSLQSMLTDLGLGGIPKSQGYGANKGGRYGYGARGHPGVDYAAPVGTKLYAPISGTAAYSYDHISGRAIKLVDAEGNAIKLSHLSKVGEQLQAMMDAAGGAVQVAKGQLLGYSGGARSDPKRGNSTGPHVDIMIYSKDGTILNPERFKSGQGSRSPVAVPVTTPDAPPKVPKPTTPLPVNTPDKPGESAEDIRKRMDAQIKAILAKVDIKVLTKEAAMKLLQGIEADATKVAQRQGKGWEEFAAIAKQAGGAIESLTKKTKELSKDALGDLRREFEFTGKSGLPEYVKGLQALISQQEKVASSAKKGSKEQKEAMDVVIAARNALKDAQAGKGAAFVTDADLSKYRAQAEEVIRLEKNLGTSTDTAWRQRAMNRIQAFGQLPQAAQNVLTFLKGQDQVEESLSEKAKAREKEQRDLRAKVADEKRQLTVSAAQLEQARIQELNREELASFKGTAAQRLALVKRQAQDEFNARMAVARATRDKELRENANAFASDPKNAVRLEKDRQANQRFANEETAATNARNAATRQARQGLTEEGQAVAGLIGKYNELREALLRKGDSGNLSAEDMTKYGRNLAQVWEDAKKAGVSALPEIQKAHAAARGFADVAIDHNAAAIEQLARDGAYDGVADQFSRAAEAGEKLKVSTEDVLAGLPESSAEWDRYVKTMTDLDVQGKLAVGALDALKDRVRDLKTEAGNQEIILKIRTEMIDRGQDPDAPDPYLLRRLPEETGMPVRDEDGGISYAPVNVLDVFQGDPAAVLEMGRQLGQEFIDGVADELTDADFSLLGVDMLNALAVALDGKPEWAKVRASIMAGLDLASAVDETIADVARNPEGYSDGGHNIKPKNAPANRFNDLSAVIFDSTEKLRTDDTFGNWLAGELDKAREAGQLTDDQLQTLKATLEEIRSGGPALPPDLAAERLEALDSRLDDLVRGFEAGETAGKDFAAQVFDVLPALERMAKAAERNGDPALAQKYRDRATALASMVDPVDAAAHSVKLLTQAKEELADAMGMTERPFQDTITSLEALRGQAGVDQVELEKLIDAFERLQIKTEKQQGIQKVTEKLQTFGQYAQQAIPAVTAAIQVLGDASEEEAAAWGESLSSMVNDVVNFATAIAKGDYIGAAIQALTSIFTYFAREAAAARAEMKKTADYNKQFKFDKDGYGTRTVTKSTSGFLFWSKTTYKEEIDEMRRDIALGVEGAVNQGMSSGLQEAVEKNDPRIFEKAIGQQLKDVVFKNLVEGFMNSAAVVALMGPLVKQLMDALASGNTELINKALGDFKSGVAALRPQMQSLIDAAGMVDDALTTPEEKAAREKQKALQTAEELRSIEEQQNELLYTQGKRGRAEYEKEKLRLAQERIRLEMEGEIARLQAAGATEEEINRLRQRYLLTAEQQQAEYDRQQRERQAQFAKDLSGLRMNNAETALSIEEKLMMSTARTEEEKYAVALKYAEKRAELTRARLKIEEAAAIAEVDMTLAGADQMVAALREKYKLLGEEVDAELTVMANNRANQLAEQARVEREKQAEEAKRARESMIQSWHQALSGGVSALLNSDSPLNAMYEGVRNRMAQAIQDGLVVKRVLGKLDPLFDQLDQALSKGFDASGIIAQIGAALPGLSVEMQASLGPIFAALNASIPKLTTAVNDNTKAVKELQMMQTTVVQFRDVGQVSDRTPARLARFV